jgi:hypothetical protein
VKLISAWQCGVGVLNAEWEEAVTFWEVIASLTLMGQRLQENPEVSNRKFERG